LSSLIERTERHSKEFENEKGEISNIENIYKKVFGKISLPHNSNTEEYNNFRKNIESHIQKP